MPLFAISGLPGHGKTLRTIEQVEKLRLASNREVFYHGITDLALPWTALSDPKKWTEVPDGAIVVIDEAWRTFPKRPPSGAVPFHVQELATARHRGLDLFLVTQHALNQLDHFVRGLVDYHTHVRRMFGTQRATLFQWEGGLGDPDDYHSKQKAQTAIWSYPKNVFDWYKSAEVHTIQAKPPWKKIAVIVGGIAVVPMLGWLAWSQVSSGVNAAEETGAELVEALPGKPGALHVGFDATDLVPVVQAVPFSAPFYQDAVKVSDVPQVSGCGVLQIDSTVKCSCTDQQGNVLDLEHRVCLAYFRRGAFNMAGEEYYPQYEPYLAPLAPPNLGETAGAQAQPGAAAPEPSSRSDS